MDALGEAMRARKAELLAEFKADGLPVQTHTMKGAPVEHVGMAQCETRPLGRVSVRPGGQCRRR